MTKRKSRSKATPVFQDWKLKSLFLKSLHNANNHRAFVVHYAQTVCTRDDDIAAFIDLFYDRYRKWHDGVAPDEESSIKFWKWVIAENKLQTSHLYLWSCSILDFISVFRETPRLKAAVLDLLMEGGSELRDADTEQLEKRYVSLTDPSASSLSPYGYVIHGDTRLNHESGLTGWRSGRIHVHQFYCMPETAKAWAALVDSNNYRMYIDCWMSLAALVDSEHWQTATSNGHFNAAMVLGGGGSPEKDRVIANSLASKLAEGRLEYVISDISYFMLHESARRLLDSHDNFSQKVNPDFILKDFMKLDATYTRPHKWRNAVWAILGGTIGNVMELDLFRSVNGPSRAGDLLIIGLDTIGSDSPETFSHRMKVQYRSKEVDHLLLGSAGSAAARGKKDEPLVDVSISGVSGSNSFSNIPNSWTVVCSSSASDGKKLLATSTRYVLDDFLAFARQLGWEHLGTTPAPAESTFRQLLFRRMR